MPEIGGDKGDGRNPGVQSPEKNCNSTANLESLEKKMEQRPQVLLSSSSHAAVGRIQYDTT